LLPVLRLVLACCICFWFFDEVVFCFFALVWTFCRTGGVFCCYSMVGLDILTSIVIFIWVAGSITVIL
jgi:hypothetical protein